MFESHFTACQRRLGGLGFLFILTHCGTGSDNEGTRIQWQNPNKNVEAEQENPAESADAARTSPTPTPEPTSQPEPTPPSDDGKPVDPVTLGLSKIVKDSIKEELTYISHDARGGRLSGTAGNIEAADYIISKLEEINIPPAQEGTYRQSFRIANGPTRNRTTSNIVARLEGTDPVLKNEIVIIGAHMDHTGTLSLGYTCSPGQNATNNICNGADDNGSGTVAVLNVAKALAAVRANLKRTVLFMWFSGEEVGLEGSWYYTRNPLFSMDKTVYMINLDMVGYMDSNNNTLAGLGGRTSARGAAILSSIAQNYPDQRIRLSDRAGGGSDHVPFMNAGIPGVFFHTGVDNNPNYHRTSDTQERIDYKGLKFATDVTFQLLYAVSNDNEISAGVTFSGSPIKRAPLVTEEELKQTCHHLGENPHSHQVTLDSRQGN